MEKWIKILIWSVIISIIGNFLFFIIGSFNYGMCYSDIQNYVCGAGSLALQGLIIAAFAFQNLFGLTYILPAIVIFLVGFYALPLIQKRLHKSKI